LLYSVESELHKDNFGCKFDQTNHFLC
jgi:hypothetical protein